MYLQGLKQKQDEKYKSIITKQNFLQIIYEGKFLSLFYNQVNNINENSPDVYVLLVALKDDFKNSNLSNKKFILTKFEFMLNCQFCL